MQRTKIADLRQAIGQAVKLQGWLQTLRDQKKMQFLVVRDSRGLVQVVFEKAAQPELAGVDLANHPRIGAHADRPGNR